MSWWPFKRRKTYGVGDIAPKSLLDRKPEDGPIGAMISVDPQTNR